MSIESNLWGEEIYQGSDSQEVSKLLETYPAAAEQTGMFFFLAMRERLPWIAQLDEKRQMELRDYCHSLESLRRRRQEWRSNHE